jgi:hypothetical protein
MNSLEQWKEDAEWNAYDVMLEDGIWTCRDGGELVGTFDPILNRGYMVAGFCGKPIRHEYAEGVEV